VALWAVLGAAVPARAQESVRDTLSFLLTNQSVTTDDFVKDQEAAAAARDTLSGLLLVELSTLPIGSSAGGFLYRFNPTLATIERISDSFGPFMIERTQTSGRGHVSLGLSYRYARFDTLDGRPLRDGSLITTANRFTDESAPFDRDVLSLDIRATTVTAFATYGVTDRLDLEAAIPVVRLNLSGERRNLYRGDVFLQARAAASVTGLADMSVRAKYAAWQTTAAGLGVFADVRLPTGRQEHLLGTGRAALRLSAIASIGRGPLEAHLEAGASRGGASDELRLGGAVVFAATPRLTLVGELVGRRMDALARIESVAAAHPAIPGVETTRLLPRSRGTDTVLASLGVKWNAGRTWLLNANVLVPLTSTGLVARATPSTAFDYTFD
jgi:hypothetical protein